MDIEDPEQLAAYLRRQGDLAPDAPLEARVLAGGVSNKTLWVAGREGENRVLVIAHHSVGAGTVRAVARRN